MTNYNTWHKDQERTSKHTFKPKWDQGVILKIIADLNKMIDIVDIQYNLAKDHDISLRTAKDWVSMGRQIMVDMNNGLNIDEAIIRYRERKNLLRRKRGLHKDD